MTRVIYQHDCRPFLRNPWIEVDEYDYKHPDQSADWPKEYQHPLGCKITYESELSSLSEKYELSKYLREIEDMSK